MESLIKMFPFSGFCRKNLHKSCFMFNYFLPLLQWNSLRGFCIMAAKALNKMCSLGGIIVEQIKTLVPNWAVLQMTSSSALFGSSNAPMGPTQPHKQEPATEELEKECRVKEAVAHSTEDQQNCEGLTISLKLRINRKKPDDAWNLIKTDFSENRRKGQMRKGGEEEKSRP